MNKISTEQLDELQFGRQLHQRPAAAAQWQPIETAPRDGSYIIISLKKRHWYDGPQVVRWYEPKRPGNDDLRGWSLAEGWTYTDADIRGWAPIPQAYH